MIRLPEHVQRRGEGPAVADRKGFAIGAGCDGYRRHRCVEPERSQRRRVVFDDAVDRSGDERTKQVLNLPLIRFSAQGSGEHPAFVGIAFKHQLAAVGLEAQTRNGRLIEQEDLFPGGFLPFLDFLSRELDDIEVKAESCEHECHEQRGPVSHGTRGVDVCARR